MVGILRSYWGGLFSGAMLVSGRVSISKIFIFQSSLVQWWKRMEEMQRMLWRSHPCYLTVDVFCRELEQQTKIQLAGAQPPNQLLICLSFSRDNGHSLLICSSVSTSQTMCVRFFCDSNWVFPKIGENPQNGW